MDAGLCPYCSTPYASADVVGVGILRARPEVQGGPTLEYRCAACGRIIVLVPHGDGRYAPPGAPPPPPVPPEQRRPAWVEAAARRGNAAPPRTADAGERADAAAGARTRTTVGAGAATGPQQPPPDTTARPVGPTEALELLGVAPTATRAEVEHAFRSRSLGCHPDKVAHLDADFQALAHRKFQRLLEAFRLLTE